MQRILKGLRHLSTRTAVMLLVGAVVALGLVNAAVWTESAGFCALCHVMAPEVRTHAVSPHAAVECGACHTGPGLIGFLKGKLGNVREALAYLSGAYTLPHPAPADGLPPATLTCLRCHPTIREEGAPRLVTVPRFQSDAANTRLNLYYTLDPARVHWHVTHPVTYLAADGLRQQIPWVTNGAEVYSTTLEVPAGALFVMDCATCHNRTGHPLHTPEALVDKALAQGLLSPKVPYLRREALAALTTPYPDEATARAALQGFAERYRTAYPNLYPSYEAELAQAAQVLPELYSLSVFPALGMMGGAYPDNAAHEGMAGCFHCHDGQHLSATGERVTRNCTTCHGVPVLQAATAPVPTAPFLPPPQPASHQAADWYATHGKLKDESCAHCHAPTFCTNPLCHGPGVAAP